VIRSPFRHAFWTESACVRIVGGAAACHADVVGGEKRTGVAELRVGVRIEMVQPVSDFGSSANARHGDS
jgi:hypothetical protein